MLVEAVTFFLGVAILFYCLFAGADFGAGILEIFRGSEEPERQKELVTHAIAPVWEANHVWLILAVVILFNGFPRAYTTISTTFHIPMALMLLGVVLRGCAFTFRHYDAVRDRSQHYYGVIFRVSSLLTPFFLGVIAGGVFLGRPIPPSPSFVEAYVLPWANLFCFAVGLFTCALFAFLAAVYLIGESEDDVLRGIFVRRARAANVAAVVAGALVFVSAETSDLPLVSRFFRHPGSLACLVVSTLFLYPLWRALHRRQIVASRVLAAGQVTLVLFGWFALQLPYLVAGTTLTLYEAAAPAPTLRALLGALVIGSLLIFPSLYFLFRVFKGKGDCEDYGER